MRARYACQGHACQGGPHLEGGVLCDGGTAYCVALMDCWGHGDHVVIQSVSWALEGCWHGREQMIPVMTRYRLVRGVVVADPGALG